MAQGHDSILGYCYENNQIVQSLNKIKDEANISSFDLYTTYPGLLIGSGYMSSISSIKIGFGFEFVSGEPYIPGSELKGMIRSIFPLNEKETDKLSYINSIIKKEYNFEKMKELENNIFENKDVFIGAYLNTQGDVLDYDYITPISVKPNPLKYVKVKPGVCFRFYFIIKNDFDNIDKINLFKQIILDMGVGAKTNVGLSHFAMGNEVLKYNSNKNTKASENKIGNMHYYFYNNENDLLVRNKK